MSTENTHIVIPEMTYKIGKVVLNKDFMDVEGNLFGSTLLPASIYEARKMEVSGIVYVYPALRESSDLLVVDNVRSIPGARPYYTLAVYNQNGSRWIPCATGSDWAQDTSYINFINTVDACLLKQLLAMDIDDYYDKDTGVYKTGYAISHWVFELTNRGTLKPIDKSVKSARTQCAITGYQSATWIITHKANGSTKKSGERIAYVASGFIPIHADDMTMHNYHALGYFLNHAIGRFTSTNPTAKGLEIEFNFHANIGENDRTQVNADLSDKILYEGVYLNRRGVMAAALLKLYRFQPIITSDSTVHFELLMRPCMSLTALKDEFCVLVALFDIKSRYGSHIHVSITNSDIENLFMAFHSEDKIYADAKELFTPLIEKLREDSIAVGENISPVEDIFGRIFTRWANAWVGYCDHYSAINVTEYHTIEWRLAKYINELQYLRLINMVCEMTRELYAVLTGKKNMTDAQKKVLKIWDDTKAHNTRTDKNASKTPNENGTRHRNMA